VLAGREIGPDALCLRRRRLDSGGATDAGMITGDDGEDFDAADIAAPQHPRGRADVGKHAAFAGRHDHQLEIFCAVLIDAAGERGGEIHLGRPPP